MNNQKKLMSKLEWRNHLIKEEERKHNEAVNSNVRSMRWGEKLNSYQGGTERKLIDNQYLPPEKQ